VLVPPDEDCVLVPEGDCVLVLPWEGVVVLDADRSDVVGAGVVGAGVDWFLVDRSNAVAT
jgi:hypothetical protein